MAKFLADYLKILVVSVSSMVTIQLENIKTWVRILALREDVVFQDFLKFLESE